MEEVGEGDVNIVYLFGDIGERDKQCVDDGNNLGCLVVIVVVNEVWDSEFVEFVQIGCKKQGEKDIIVGLVYQID